jgi:hypothetical protein
MKLSIRPRPWLPPTSAFAGFRFPPDVIVVAVRWYLRYNLMGMQRKRRPDIWTSLGP